MPCPAAQPMSLHADCLLFCLQVMTAALLARYDETELWHGIQQPVSSSSSLSAAVGRNYLHVAFSRLNKGLVLSWLMPMASIWTNRSASLYWPAVLPWAWHGDGYTLRHLCVQAVTYLSSCLRRCFSISSSCLSSCFCTSGSSLGLCLGFSLCM